MRINQAKSLEKQILIKYLLEGICQTSFTKVKDNTTRTLYCTLQLDFIPAKYISTVEKILDTSIVSDPDLIPVWDVVDGKWKSFKISKIVYFLTADELVKENNVGYNVDSQTVNIIEQRRNEAIQRHKQRQKDLKDQAERNTKIINGDDDEDSKTV